ncbi:MAG: hemolysin III [Desulfobacterales bacterium]|nr:MAG: hemolysin III [Desulfobacterales bacterium]
METPTPTGYNQKEELANGLTHALATALSIGGLVLMLILSSRYGDTYHIVSSSIYGASLIMLYLASTLYHLVSSVALKSVFRKIDHAMIYLLIAGTYTPFTLITLRGTWGWSLFGTVWGIALIGLFLEFFLPERIRWLSLTLYLGLGWMIVIAAKPLVAGLEPNGFFLLVAGGISYSSGVIFYVWKSLSFHHAIWHLFVMAGSLFHFFAVLFYVIPLG